MSSVLVGLLFRWKLSTADGWLSYLPTAGQLGTTRCCLKIEIGAFGIYKKLSCEKLPVCHYWKEASKP